MSGFLKENSRTLRSFKPIHNPIPLLYVNCKGYMLRGIKCLNSVLFILFQTASQLVIIGLEYKKARVRHPNIARAVKNNKLA